MACLLLHTTRFIFIFLLVVFDQPQSVVDRSNDTTVKGRHKWSLFTFIHGLFTIGKSIQARDSSKMRSAIIRRKALDQPRRFPAGGRSDPSFYPAASRSRPLERTDEKMENQCDEPDDDGLRRPFDDTRKKRSSSEIDPFSKE